MTLSLVHDTLASQLFSSGGARRTFGHASHAAFLAARYLHRRRLPQRQLEALLLVAGPDGTRTVPVPLRETAAWLASMDLGTGRWLAEADPQSLIGHDSYMESDDLRSIVAASLLSKADEFELGERAWIGSLRLSHPGLADQVIAVLNGHPVQPNQWPDFAQCRLALRLAAHATSAELTARLLEIVEGSGWNSHMRSMAAAAVLAGDPEAAAARLREILQRLRDHARIDDPDDELKGNLLDDLWPQYVPTEEILPLLVARRRRSVIGSYWMFLRDFAARVAEDELEGVLTWAAAAALHPTELDQPSDDDDEDIDEDEIPLGLLDVTLIDALVDRALSNAEPVRLLPLVARLLWLRFQRLQEPILPIGLDESDAHDPETATKKRRLLADALVRSRATDGGFDGADAFKLIRAWRANTHFPPVEGDDGDPPPRSRLLDAKDFGWALDRAIELEADGDRSSALAMGEVAVQLFDYLDSAAIEVAWQQQGTVNWDALAPYFDAMPLAGETANRLREWHQRQQRPRVRHVDPANDERLREDLARLYDRVCRRDVSEFWLLAWNLQFPPGFSRGPLRRDDRLLDFPGVGALGADAPARLAQAAHAYLLRENDRADEWLGTDRYDKRAWAGYLALRLLDELGQLDDVPSTRLASWTGAVLWYNSVPVRTGDPDHKAVLLRRVLAADPSRFAALLGRYVRGELRRGSVASEVRLVDPSAEPTVLATWLELLHELTDALLGPPTSPTEDEARDPFRSFEPGESLANASFAWEMLFERLARTDANAAEDLVVDLLGRATDERAHPVAATAVEVLLEVVPVAWRRLFPLISGDTKLGRSVAATIASGHREVKLSANLDEHQLVGLYVWLAELYPPEDDREAIGAHFFTPDEQARRMRDGVLTTVANRGTDESVRILAELHDLFPLRSVVTSNLIRARIALFATAWLPPPPEGVQALLMDVRRRLVRSSEELGWLVEETLSAINEEMVRSGEFLWDRVPTGRGSDQRWRPKPEAALAAFIAHELDLRLQGRGLAVHREVLIKASNPYGAGDKPDIIVEANVPADALSHTTPERFASSSR